MGDSATHTSEAPYYWVGPPTGTSYAVPISGPIVGLAAGTHHTCVALAAGSTECWGYNPYGQLGDGTVTMRDAPVDSSCGSAGDPVLLIAAGRHHSCGYVTSGTLYCWGYNSMGQLGDGTTDQRNTPTATVALGGTVVLLEAGGLSTVRRPLPTRVLPRSLVLLTLHCPPLLPARSLTPSVLFARSISIAPSQCAYLSTGDLKCWGSNTYGQLGVGDTTSRSSPTTVGGLPTDDPLSVMSMGEGHMCAATTGGQMFCWGKASYAGEMPNGISEINRHTPLQIYSSYNPVTLVGAYAAHTCAVVSGVLKCWGDNSAGHLGVGGETSVSDMTGAISGTAVPTDVLLGAPRACPAGPRAAR